MREKLRVAIVGLGNVGSAFLDRLVHVDGRGVEIAAVAEIDAEAPGVEMAQEKEIPVFNDTGQITDMGHAVDIIFELTGDPATRKTLREAMVMTGNTHTVIAPEIMAYLIWDLITDEELPEAHSEYGY